MSLLVFVLGIGTGLLPAYQAGRLKIVDALRRTGCMNWLSQVIAVTGVTLRSIPQRLGSATVAVIGIAGVVIVFTAVLSIAEGFRAAMRGTGDPRTVIVLRSGSDTEMTSGFGGDDVKLISEGPGIERGPNGPVRVARALRHRRTSPQAKRNRRQRPAARRFAVVAAGQTWS